MKVEKILNQPLESIFEILVEVSLEELRAAQKAVEKNVLIEKGASYICSLSNKLGRSEQVAVHIEPFKKNAYKSCVVSKYGENYIQYNYEAIDSNHTKIVYEEKFVGKTKAASLNHKIFSRLTSGANEKKMLMNLERLSRYAGKVNQP